MDGGPGFERDLGHAVRALIAPGAITVIAAWPEPEAAALAVLGTIALALERHGIARGRQLLMIPNDSGRGGGDEAARALGARLGIVALARDPERRPHFTAGRTAGGVVVELDDELREAEAVVLAGPVAPASAATSLPAMLASGLASRRTAQGLAAGTAADRAEALRMLAPCVCVGWDAEGVSRVLELPELSGGTARS